MKRRSIACDKCGFRMESIPEECPECGEIIRDRLDPHLLPKLERALSRSRLCWWLFGIYLLLLIPYTMCLFSGPSFWLNGDNVIITGAVVSLIGVFFAAILTLVDRKGRHRNLTWHLHQLSWHAAFLPGVVYVLLCMLTAYTAPDLVKLRNLAIHFLRNGVWVFTILGVLIIIIRARKRLKLFARWIVLNVIQVLLFIVFVMVMNSEIRGCNDPTLSVFKQNEISAKLDGLAVKMVFEETFEDYPIPGGVTETAPLSLVQKGRPSPGAGLWAWKGSKLNVTNEDKKDGVKSLKCYAAGFAKTVPASSSIMVEFDVLVLRKSTGLSWGPTNVEFSISINREYAYRPNGPQISFRSNGSISWKGIAIGTWEHDKWHHIRLGSEGSCVQYADVDGRMYSGCQTDNFSFKTTFNSASGNNTITFRTNRFICLFDNIRIYLGK